MTRAQQTYDRIEKLVGDGIEKADAFKQLAEEYGQPVDSIRGAYYTGRKQTLGDNGTSRARRSKKRETTEEDAIDAAIATLERSIADIQSEVETARERSKEARAEHEALSAAAGPRIETIKAKIELLRGETKTDKETRAARA